MPSVFIKNHIEILLSGGAVQLCHAAHPVSISADRVAVTGDEQNRQGVRCVAEHWLRLVVLYDACNRSRKPEPKK